MCKILARHPPHFTTHRQGPRMRKQHNYHGGGGGGGGGSRGGGGGGGGGGWGGNGGFGGAWSGWDTDAGGSSSWGTGSRGSGNTAQDYARKVQQTVMNMHNMFNIKDMASDFFSEGFSESPVADSSQRVLYFDKWFPQVSIIQMSLTPNHRRLLTKPLAGPCGESPIQRSRIQSIEDAGHCPSSRRHARLVPSPRFRVAALCKAPQVHTSILQPRPLSVVPSHGATIL
jgi:hypothetical protein